jgi:hypothetical protein
MLALITDPSLPLMPTLAVPHCLPRNLDGRAGPAAPTGYLLADARRSTGAGQVSPKGVMGLGRGPGRFCPGGEVLLEQVGADPEAGGTCNGAAGRRLL